MPLPSWALPVGIGIGSLIAGPAIAGLAGAGGAGMLGATGAGGALGAAGAGGAYAGGIGSLFGSKALMGAGLMASALGPMMGGPTLDGSKPEKAPKLAKSYKRDYEEAPEGYRPGVDPEHMYFRKRKGYADGGRVSESTKYERARRKADENAPSLMDFIRRSTVDRPIYGGWETPEGAAYAEATAEMDRTGTPPETIFSRRNYAMGGPVAGYNNPNLPRGGWYRPSPMWQSSTGGWTPPQPGAGGPMVRPPRPQYGVNTVPYTPRPAAPAPVVKPQVGSGGMGGGGGSVQPTYGGMPQQQSPNRDSFMDNQMLNRVAERKGGGMAQGGLVKGFAEGGIASLAPAPAQAGGSDNILIEQAAMALMGQVPNPEPIIQQFVQEFGKEALMDLAERVKSLMAQQGDGLNDKIPANLSEGEYVIPADAVSHLGNGSTDAGGKKLDSMVERARALRGAPKPKQINPEQAMPV